VTGPGLPAGWPARLPAGWPAPACLRGDRHDCLRGDRAACPCCRLSRQWPADMR